MAFTRSMLKALGIDAEKIDEIMDAHVEVVNSIKDERDNLKADNERLKESEKELTKLKSDGGTWEEKYTKLNGEFEKFKEDQKKAEENGAKDKAYRALLKKLNVSEKRIDSIMKLTDLSEAKLTDGKFEGEDKLSESIKTEWADFITTEKHEGADTETPPGNGGGSAEKHEIPTIF